MAVNRHPSGRFRIDFRIGGRRGVRKYILLPASITTEKEAILYESSIRRIASKDVSVVLKRAAVRELFRIYLQWYEIHRSPTTFRDIKSVYGNHLSKFFDSMVAEEIAVEHINIYKQIRKREGAGNRTLNKELSYFSGFLSWCGDEDNRYIKPRRFRIKKLPYKRPKPNILSFDEALHIIMNMDTFYRTLFLLLYGLGLRLSEARNVTIENIDFTNRLIKVRQKGGEEKVLPLPRLLEQTLLQMDLPKTGYVFLNKKTGKPVQDVRKALSRACSKAQITRKVYPHLFRHSIATYFLGKNINLRTIQGILGHKDVKTTEFYTHVIADHLSGAVKVFDEDVKRLPWIQ